MVIAGEARDGPTHLVSDPGSRHPDDPLIGNGMAAT
jgi:hypothetical protein